MAMEPPNTVAHGRLLDQGLAAAQEILKNEPDKEILRAIELGDALRNAPPSFVFSTAPFNEPLSNGVTIFVGLIVPLEGGSHPPSPQNTRFASSNSSTVAEPGPHSQLRGLEDLSPNCSSTVPRHIASRPFEDIMAAIGSNIPGDQCAPQKKATKKRARGRRSRGRRRNKVKVAVPAPLHNDTSGPSQTNEQAKDSTAPTNLPTAIQTTDASHEAEVNKTSDLTFQEPPAEQSDVLVDLLIPDTPATNHLRDPSQADSTSEYAG